MSGVNQSAFMNLRSFTPPGPAYELYAWGYNGSGQLGQGDSGYGTQRSSPVQVGSGTNWYQVSSASNGGVHAIKTDGTMWSWGFGYHGNGGDGFTLYSSPVQVGALTTWSQVSNNDHVMAIKTDGTLWGWGGNYDGELGLGDSGFTERTFPVQIGALTNWAKVESGKTHTLAIKTDGTLWAWGDNYKGSLGLGNTTNRSSPVQVGALTTWAEISAGQKGSIAIKTDGTMWSWGYNGGLYGGYGQLGLGDATNRSSPVQIGALTTWSKVSMGGYFTCLALKTDGTMWSWGQNSGGKLGLGDTTIRSSPVQIGALTTWAKVSAGAQAMSAIKTDGTSWGWGSNFFGAVGDGTNTNRSSPVQVGSETNWFATESGSNATFGITETE